MAREKARKPTDNSASASVSEGAALRPSAEMRYAGEIERLKAADKDSGDPRPPGWRLSARAVRRFILGDEALSVSRKFYGGDDPLVDRAIVTLISAQGLMLVGEPGTAKSMLSELLAAAISGSSDLVVQGSAGTTDDHIRYSWNYGCCSPRCRASGRWCRRRCSRLCVPVASCASRTDALHAGDPGRADLDSVGEDHLDP